MLPFSALLKRPRAVRGLVIRTSAKVNWTLEVLGKRADGYHELSTILQSVDLWDRLTVEPADTITLVTLDGRLEVAVTYQAPAFDTGFDPGLLALDVPQGVEIQDFR